MNVEKTKMMVVQTIQPHHYPMLTYRGEHIQFVRSFKYLGIDVPATNKWIACFNSRLQASWKSVENQNLDRTNFTSWEYKMHQYLVGQGYWSYIQGAHEDQPDSTHANYPAWEQVASRVLYMTQPRSFESRIHPSAVCRLKKPLYGLKQAPRVWHSKIMQYLHQIGFRMSKSDTSF